MIKPGDRKFLERRTLFAKTGSSAARIMSMLIAEYGGGQDCVLFNEKNGVIDDIVEKYFQRVDSFKADNDYADGDFINASKIAGFTVDMFINCKAYNIDLSNIFQINESNLHNKWYNYSVLLYIYLLSCAILTIEVKKIDSNAERDFFLCAFRGRSIHAEWMSWAMFSLQGAYLSTWSIGRVVRWAHKKKKNGSFLSRCLPFLYDEVK